MYCCVSIFQLIYSLPTYPPTNVNLTYTYRFLFHSRFCVLTYMLESDSFICWPTHCVYLCKYISTYLFLTHIPTHKCKLNLYLPLTYSIPDYWCLILYEGLAHARAASVSNRFHTVFFCVSICQLIYSLPTYPPTSVNWTYNYPYLFHSRCWSLRTWCL